MASSARHLFFLAAVLAVAAPRSADAWGGGRFFFSKTTRPEAAVEHEKSAAVPNAAAADTNAAPAFSRPSTGGSGYGLNGRPEENYPPDYFRRGVHRNAEKLTATTTTDVPATAGTLEEAGGGGGERVRTTFPEDGSGRGRPPTDVPATTGTEEEAAPVGGTGGGDLEGVQPYPENGSGRGRPPWYYTGFHRSSRQQQQQQEQRDYGMSDTRLYQNGRYYYDVEAGRYGYGRKSNPMRTTRPDEEEFGSGYEYGRPRGGAGGRRYRDAAGYQQQQYGNDEEFGNAAMDDQNTNGGFQFQDEAAGQNGRYTP